MFIMLSFRKLRELLKSTTKTVLSLGEAPEFVINSLSMLLSLFTLFHFTVPIQICRIICREYKCQFVQIRENMSFSKKKKERHCLKKIQIYLSKLYFIVTLIMPLWKRGYIVLQLSVGRYVGRSVDCWSIPVCPQ